KPVPVILDRARHGQRDHTQGPAVVVGHALQPGKVVTQGRVVDIGRIVFHRAHHRSWVHETSQVVHVAVGVVTDDALAEPQNLGHAQVGSQVGLKVGAGE